MRIDRALTLRCFHPVIRFLGAQRKGYMPILMYHGIELPTSYGDPANENGTSPEMFAQQMNYLRQSGYSVVGLEEGLQAMLLGECNSNNKKYVVITFDNGYRNVYTEAFPVLAEHGFGATVFLVSGLVSDCRVDHNGHEYLTWREVRELGANGIRFGSHTVTHPELHGIKEEQIEFELSYSKETIEDRLGEAVRTFSYPFALPDRNQKLRFWLRDLLETYGYVCAVSATLGTARASDDRFFLPRLPVDDRDDRPLLRAKLEGGYDWLRFSQRLYEAVRDPNPLPVPEVLRRA